MNETKEEPETTTDGQPDAMDPKARETLKQGIAQAVAQRVQAARENQAAQGESPDSKSGRAPQASLVKTTPKSDEVVNKIAPVFIDFQPDAIELEVTPVPGGLRWVLYVVTLLILTTIAWAYWTKIETFVVAHGKLVPISDPVLIQATAGSPIRQIHVRFGDIVRAGDLLATLDSTLPSADVESLTGRMRTGEARLARLIAEQGGSGSFDLGGDRESSSWQAEAALYLSRKLAYESQLAEIAAEMDSLRAKITGSQDEATGLQEALVIHREVEDRMKSMVDQGAGSKNTYLSQKLNRQEVELKIQNLNNQVRQFEHELMASEKRQQRVTADRIAEVNGQIVETKNELHVLKSDLEKATRMKELSELRVPTDLPYNEFFVLEASERTSGSVVRETDPLFKLMPLKDPLRIEAEILGKDIGEVRMNDSAIIKLDALPYQKHGTLKGRLETISEGAFEKEEGRAESSYFKAYVTIDDRTIENKPVNFRVVPGMSCTVELRVGERRVIDYFLYPLFRHLDQSLREPSQRAADSNGQGNQGTSSTL